MVKCKCRFVFDLNSLLKCLKLNPKIMVSVKILPNCMTLFISAEHKKKVSLFRVSMTSILDQYKTHNPKTQRDDRSTYEYRRLFALSPQAIHLPVYFFAGNRNHDLGNASALPELLLKPINTYLKTFHTYRWVSMVMLWWAIPPGCLDSDLCQSETFYISPFSSQRFSRHSKSLLTLYKGLSFGWPACTKAEEQSFSPLFRDIWHRNSLQCVYTRRNFYLSKSCLHWTR